VGDLATLVPAGAGLAVLGVVIGYLLLANRADRADYREALALARKEADDERAERQLLQQQFDDERAVRRRAEDDAARSARAAERAAEQIAALEAAVRRLEVGERERHGG
jgi:uncharacterized membrane protein YccC